MDPVQIQTVIKTIKGLWLDQYFHEYSLFFLAAAFFFTIVFIKRSNRLLLIINILLLIGTSVYAVLWFATFQNHDYYVINLYILLVFVVLNFFWVLKGRFPKAFSSNYLKLLFLLFLIFNMNHAREGMKGRYYGWWTEYPEYKDYHVITPYLRSIGIAPLDTVICLPDMTHFTLYLMNQRGWTGCLQHNFDSTSVANSINHGAKYLIINGDYTIKQDYLQGFLKDPIGQFNTVKIFKLNKPIGTSFSP
jgi:hypothetical protein